MLGFNDNIYFTKKIEHTSNMNNNITRHSHTNCVHNVIKRMNKHIKHITNYGMGINLYNKKPRNKQMIIVTSTMVS